MSRSEMTPRSFSTDQLRAALGDVAGPARPDYLTDIVAQAGRMRQRPGWTFPERWLAMDIAVRRDGDPRTAVLAASLALLVLLTAVGIYIGTRPPPPVDLGIFEPIAGRIVYGNENALVGIDDGIWAVDPTSPDGSTTIQLISEPATPLGWSSDGTRLLIQKGDENLFILHADGSQTPVTDRLSGYAGILGSGRPSGATLSPDGTRVVFAGQTKAPAGDCHDGALFAVDADGGPVELLWESQVPQNGIVRDPTFSPDGTQLAFADGYCDSDHSVWVMDADGSDPRQIVASDVGPLGATHVHGLAWSPTGDRLALQVDDGIYTFAADGSDFKRVITPGFTSWPELFWSPDGSQIAYTTGCDFYDADGAVHGCALAIADADGTNIRRLTSGMSGPWHPGRPSTSVDPTAAPAGDASVRALLDDFVAARVAGAGAERYLLSATLPDGSPSWPAPPDEVPLLYASTSGARYERGEVEPVSGIEWPYDLAAFKVRLNAGDTVVEQLFFSALDGPAGVGYVRDGFATEIAPTTEDGRAVAGPPCDFDGYLTLRAVHPWVNRFHPGDLGCMIQLIPQDAGPSTTIDLAQRAGWDELVLMADPAWVSTDCQTAITGPDAATLAASIRSDPGLEATDPVAVTVGGIDALMMDVRMNVGATGCVNVDTTGNPADPGALFPVLLWIDGVDAVEGRVRLPATGDWMRVYLLDPPEGSSLPTVQIAVVAPRSSFDRAVEAAAPVLDTIEFQAE